MYSLRRDFLTTISSLSSWSLSAPIAFLTMTTDYDYFFYSIKCPVTLFSTSLDDINGGSIDLVSALDTCRAVGLGLVALPGLRRHSLLLMGVCNKNRALNAVQDMPQKYIRQGYRLFPTPGHSGVSAFPTFLLIMLPIIPIGHPYYRLYSFLDATLPFFFVWRTGCFKLSWLLQTYIQS